MIRYALIKINTEEPTISNINSNLLFKFTFRINAIDVTNKKHFYQNNRIDRWSSSIGIKVSNFIVNEIKVNEPVKITKEVLLWHKVFKCHK